MSKEDSTPVEKLFGSKTRAKLLRLFFENPGKSFYVREMTRVIEEQINSVRRELLNLESIGIIKNDDPASRRMLFYAENRCRSQFWSVVVDDEDILFHLL